jgi:hypothetical protein
VSWLSSTWTKTKDKERAGASLKMKNDINLVFIKMRVTRKTAAGQWEIPAQHLVQREGNAGAVAKVASCQCRVLADATGPLNVLYGGCVDTCIKAHENGEGDPSRSGESSVVVFRHPPPPPPNNKKKLKRKRKEGYGATSGVM